MEKSTLKMKNKTIYSLNFFILFSKKLFLFSEKIYTFKLNIVFFLNKKIKNMFNFLTVYSFEKLRTISKNPIIIN